MVEDRHKDDERWDTMMGILDLLFTQVADIEKNQHRMEANIEMSTKVMEQMLRDQQMKSKQIESNGQAIAQITLQQTRAREEQPPSPTSFEAAMDNLFQNGRPS